MKIQCALLLIATSFMSGCVGKHPFLTIQLCLGDKKNTEQFIQIMKTISIERNMRYIDRSEITQKELIAVGSDPGFRVMNISAVGPSNTGWAAGNTGLSEYEVSVSFSEGNDIDGAREFANETVSTLRKAWPVYVVPSDRGAMPMGCPNKEKK